MKRTYARLRPKGNGPTSALPSSNCLSPKMMLIWRIPTRRTPGGRGRLRNRPSRPQPGRRAGDEAPKRADAGRHANYPIGARPRRSGADAVCKLVSQADRDGFVGIERHRLPLPYGDHVRRLASGGGEDRCGHAVDRVEVD